MADPSRSAQLRGRIASTLLANLAVIGLLMATAMFLMLFAAINRSFTELEDRQIAGHAARVEDFKRSTLVTMEARSKDWAVWDDTYQYAHDFNAAYEASNVNGESFKNAMVDGLAVVQTATGAVRSHAFHTAEDRPWPELAAALKRLVLSPGFAAPLAHKDAYQAFASLNGELYALGAAKILRSDGSGISPGYMVFIQRVDDARASQALQAPAHLVLGSAPARSAIVKTADEVKLTSPLPDGEGRQVGQLNLRLQRPLLATANDLVILVFGGVFIVILAMLATLHWRLRELVLAPVESLHAHLQQVRATGELKLLETRTRNDEFGAVQDEFNQMAVELEQLRSQIQSQSFAIGKSQSAIGLMHNLRNCLSPVRVILERLDHEIASSLPPQAPRALKELATASTEQARREKLVEFLGAAHDQLAGRDAVNRQNVREAARNLMNAFAAIDAAQQDKSDISFAERCDLATMLSHAGNIVRFAEGQGVDTEIRTDAETVVRGNRVLLIQVIENLVMNAMEAIRESGRPDGRITLDAGLDRDSGQCRILIADNGAGFDQDVARQLFERGFSTREGALP